MCSVMFCKQMRLTYVMLAFLRDRLINNFKMEPRLSFEHRKAVLKWYWRTENIVEVQRQWRREYRTEPSTRSTIARIRDKFKTHGIIIMRCSQVQIWETSHINKPRLWFWNVLSTRRRNLLPTGWCTTTLLPRYIVQDKT